MVKPIDLARAVGFRRWLGGWRRSLNGSFYRLFAHRDPDVGTEFQSVVVVRPDRTAEVVTGTGWVLDRLLHARRTLFGGYLHPRAVEDSFPQRVTHYTDAAPLSLRSVVEEDARGLRVTIGAAR